MATAEIKAVITAEDKASSTLANFGGSFTRLAGAMAVGNIAAMAFSKAVDIVGDAVKRSVGAAFEQVRSVQNATFALKAYEGNAEKVNAVLKDLVSFARSDMGTLFKREELFSAAQTLKIFGQSTETLTDKVKILAKGSASAGAPIQELAMIIGRAAAKGRLDAVDFDMLIERGVGLDRSMRGAAVTSESLFTALDKALPASLLEGRANTIDGAMIKLESAFRDLGSSVLGVDKETSQFIKGGLGDTAMNALKQFTDLLKNPEVKIALDNIGRGLAQAGVAIINGIGWAWNNILKPFFDWVMSIVNNPDVQMFAKVLWEQLKVAFAAIADIVITQLWPALKELWHAIEPYAPYIGGALLAVLGALVVSFLIAAGVITIVITAVTKLITWLVNLQTWFQNLSVNGNRAVIGFLRNVANAIANFIGNLYNAGRDMIDGLVRGIVNNGGRVIEAVKRIISGSLDAIKKFFKIGSPSKVMAEQGGFIMQGLAKGLEGGASMVEKAMQGVSPEVNPSMNATINSGVGSGNSSPAGTVKGGNTTTININVGLMTGSAIERREAAQKMFEDLKVIASQQGQSVSQMIGSA